MCACQVFLGYNYGIMWNKLRIPIITVLAVTAVILMVCRYQGYDQNGEKYKAQCMKDGPSATAVETLVCTIEHSQEAQQSNNGVAWWHKLLTWPEGITGWLLMLTMVAVGWQAWETRKAADASQSQSTEMAKQVIAMNTQNKNARDRDRANFTILKVDQPELLAPYKFSGDTERSIPIRIRMTLVNDGAIDSKAFNLRGFGRINIAQMRDDFKPREPQEMFNLQLPGTFRSSGIENPLTVTVTRMYGITDSDYTMVGEELLERVRRKELRLEIIGEICYDDAFTDGHKTPFWFIWVQEGGDHGGDWWDSSHWINYSGKST